MKTLFPNTCRLPILLAAGLLSGALNAQTQPSYAVVVSRKTDSDAAWRRVVECLQQKHGAHLISYESAVGEALADLRARFPRHVCFVAQPSEVSREFVGQVHRLTRRLDDDPYTDCFWGILTGYDASNALRIAQHTEPLTVRKVASGTEIALEMCEEGVWYCELKQGRMLKKERGGEPVELECPADTTEALVKTLTEYGADLFVTSGHATERDWQIGYRYRNGSFRCAQGQLYGLNTGNQKFPIASAHPRVYLPIGNCLMGHIDGPEAMALAWMNSGGVLQMIGYTVPTWYGYAGWGCLDYFLEQPGRYTFTEAFFANHAALIHRLHTFFPELADADGQADGGRRAPVQLTEKSRAAGLTANDARGLLFDRDTVAFYGDPAWTARMARGALAWEQTLTEKDGVWTLEIKPNRGKRTFEPINRNGSQRGFRPIVQYLPRRVKEVQILAGADLQPVITDDFILVPNPRQCDPAKPYRVVFQARPATQP